MQVYYTRIAHAPVYNITINTRRAFPLDLKDGFI